ncbi:MAG: hypothetical protein MJZ34_13835 [Paludibacteraceae bacterium]|nr:hypothetical protein [Paludibacteraceae bacterium]
MENNFDIDEFNTICRNNNFRADEVDRNIRHALSYYAYIFFKRNSSIRKRQDITSDEFKQKLRMVSKDIYDASGNKVDSIDNMTYCAGWSFTRETCGITTLVILSHAYETEGCIRELFFDMGGSIGKVHVEAVKLTLDDILCIDQCAVNLMKARPIAEEYYRRLYDRDLMIEKMIECKTRILSAVIEDTGCVVDIQQRCTGEPECSLMVLSEHNERLFNKDIDNIMDDIDPQKFSEHVRHLIELYNDGWSID